MLEWIFILLLGAAILLFFHNQATFEFKVSQIRWNQKETHLTSLLAERTPLVVTDIPPVAFWTAQDIQHRPAYRTVPLFEDQTLAEWSLSATAATQCPWSAAHAVLLGSVAGLGIWAARELHPAIHTNPLWSAWYRPVMSCWAGARPLWKSSCRWTVLMPTEGAIRVSLLEGSAGRILPPSLDGVYPDRLTVYDTPFVADLHPMYILVRQGTCLILPPHWYLCWQPLDDEGVCPLVCCVEYHTPVSLLLAQ